MEVRRILEYTNDVALLQYTFYSEVEFEGWPDFFDDQGAYPQRGLYEDDYLQGNVRIVLEGRRVRHLYVSLEVAGRAKSNQYGEEVVLAILVTQTHQN